MLRSFQEAKINYCRRARSNLNVLDKSRHLNPHLLITGIHRGTMTDSMEPLGIIELRIFERGMSRIKFRHATIHRQAKESLVSEELQRALGLPLKCAVDSTTINIDGEYFNPIGTIQLCWQVVRGHKTRTTTFHVLQHLPFSTALVLGDDLLSQSGILEPKANTVHVLAKDNRKRTSGRL